jgi:hypothetical protein
MVSALGAGEGLSLLKAHRPSSSQELPWVRHQAGATQIDNGNLRPTESLQET